MKRQLLSLLALLSLAVSAQAAPPLRPLTPRGAALEVLVDKPSGPGPFPVVVVGSGSGYHMRQPLLEQLSKTLVKSGVGVYRFDWAYHVADPEHGRQSVDRKAELEDMRTVIELARAASWVDRTKLFVGGKSLGSIIAWRVLREDPTLAGGLLLTPVCNKPNAEANYPQIEQEARPTLWLLGDRDPACEVSGLYSYLARAQPAARLSVLTGNHVLARGSTPEPVPSAATRRTLELAAAVSAEFVLVGAVR